MPGSSVGERLLEHRAEVAGRVAVLVRHLQAEPDRAGSRTIAGAAIGSRVHSRTSRSVPCTFSGTVAAGTSSRSAMMSHSPGSPRTGG